MSRSRTLEVFEHGTLKVSTDKDGISQAEFDALVQFNDRHQARYFSVGHQRITFTSYVGYIEVGQLSLQILPKVDRGGSSTTRPWRDGLLEMLRVAIGVRLQQPTSASQQLSRFRLLDLIAEGFLAELEPLMHAGLAKGYCDTVSNGPMFRGRLKMAEHLRDNVARADRFFVEFQTFAHDIVVNQLLGTALDTLSWCALSASVSARVEACLGRFPSVRLGGVTAAMFERVHLGRSTARYGSALRFARMILALQGPQLQSGHERVFALLFDMNTLWEAYIAALFRRGALAGLTIHTQERHEFWKPRAQVVRRVRPDIVVRSRNGQAVLVVDTKWKLPSRGIPSDDDLKQMFVYNELLGASRSVLLYPKTATSAPVSGGYATKIHGCEQRYIGVTTGTMWSTPAIQAQVARMLGELIEVTRAP